LINWTWTNPADDDFSHTTVYLDGVWETNTSDAYYNATELSANTTHEIGTHTVDTTGNVNTAWVNQTAATSAPAANGALSGTITSTTDGTGVSGVTVNLTLNSTRTVIASTTTDSNGTYIITDVEPGEYTLTASKIRFWSDSTSVVTVNSTVTANCALWLKGRFEQ
jgi:5-hydroxyisourate hydrolase-like protein (transthyretin family)